MDKPECSLKNFNEKSYNYINCNEFFNHIENMNNYKVKGNHIKKYIKVKVPKENDYYKMKITY